MKLDKTSHDFPENKPAAGGQPARCREGEEAAGWPPLLQAMLDQAREKKPAFHMPGHQGGGGAWERWRDLLGETVFSLDLTELPGLDNLQQPEGVIAAAAAEAAALFGAEETYFLVNGATAGITATLLALCQPGDQVLLPRNCHQSVLSGLILSGANPYFLPVQADEGSGLPGMLTTAELDRALTSPEVTGRTLVLLHPNYYGLAGELKEQIDLAHSRGLKVLVDEAHGTHFRTSSQFPPSALSRGADFAVQGVHKTAGAFTQAAWLHRLGNGRAASRLREALRLVQTSSPSYLLLASLDTACRQLREGRTEWEVTAIEALRLRGGITQIPGLTAPGEELLDLPGVVSFDPTRLLVGVGGLGITGFTAAEWLGQERGLLVEMADSGYLVLILTPSDRESWPDLVAALQDLSAHFGTGAKRAPSLPQPLQLPIPKQLMSPRVAFFSTRRELPLDEAAGKVAGAAVVPYPPGVPVLCPGELITEETVEFLQEWLRAGGSWPGSVSGLISVVGGS